MVIDVPEQLSRVRRAEETGLTALAAVVWLVALRPVLLLALWYLGWEVAYTHMVKLEGWNNRGWFAMLGAAFAGLSALLFAWSRYNAVRFRRTDRRTSQRLAGDGDLLSRCRISSEQLARLRESRSLRIERAARTEVVVTCADGAPFSLYHDPLGPRPAGPAPWARV
jgi:poly-beta-1,6-N-acetyl-D-glucosamine biosynthesis protein PgaD